MENLRILKGINIRDEDSSEGLRKIDLDGEEKVVRRLD